MADSFLRTPKFIYEERPVMSYAAHQREIDKDDLRRQIHALVQGSINSAERVIDIDLIEKFK